MLIFYFFIFAFIVLVLTKMLIINLIDSALINLIINHYDTSISTLVLIFIFKEIHFSFS